MVGLGLSFMGKERRDKGSSDGNTPELTAYVSVKVEVGLWEQKAQLKHSARTAVISRLIDRKKIDWQLF